MAKETEVKFVAGLTAETMAFSENLREEGLYVAYGLVPKCLVWARPKLC